MRMVCVDWLSKTSHPTTINPSPISYLAKTSLRCPFHVIANISYAPSRKQPDLSIGSQPITFIPNKAREEREVRPHIQPKYEKGDIMVRGLTAYQAEILNKSGYCGIMVALGYSVGVPFSCRTGCLLSIYRAHGPVLLELVMW
ncbi:hypothetical protein HYALB_00008391 [Hymenoscyphus albidus]|uniref:Uncharacterized protein n=1 Tax=Hymenoscyphus albidus TaxID=595503 RepID=A0A9N9Q5N6_9HELO|nr:hypothetical protein HYALB_00008391 [Hymenoscyphus albidus]